MSLFDNRNIRSLEARDLWRSIPTCYPSKHLFWPDELSENEQNFAHALADITGGIDGTEPQKDRWYQYGEEEKLEEFCFDLVNVEMSRFTDGAFPVWYGGSDQETSKAEVAYHQWRQARKEFTATQHESVIFFQRAICLAHVNLDACLDVRELAGESAERYLEDGPPYPHCNELARTVRCSVDGIFSLSRRWRTGEVLAVFVRKAVISSVVKAYWDTVIDKEGGIKICGAEVQFQDGWMTYF